MERCTYLLDANVFIEASRRYYAFDLAPGFWDNLIRHSNTNQILSIDRIKIELEKGKDELAEWAKQQFQHAFVSTNETKTITAYREIMIWVNARIQFSEAAKADFASGADGWLIAYAKEHNCVVVTHEAASLEIKRKVPIPNICQAFNVQYIDTFEMLRRLSVKFV